MVLCHTTTCIVYKLINDISTNIYSIYFVSLYSDRYFPTCVVNQYPCIDMKYFYLTYNEMVNYVLTRAAVYSRNLEIYQFWEYVYSKIQ